MKKNFRKLTLLVAVASLVGTMAGCKKGNTTPASTVAPLKNAYMYPKSIADINTGDKFKGVTIKEWDWWDLGDQDKKHNQDFMDKTGATIEHTNIPWDQYTTKLLTALAAGNGPDLVWVNTNAMPTWVTKKILAPISDYVKIDKVPAFNVSKAGQEFYTWNGKQYALTWGGYGSMKLFYRKDMFKNNGLEDPYDLFKKGQWTWDKFFDLGQKLTQDTNGDGKPDVYGYASWSNFQWLSTNGANYVKMKNNKPTFALDEPAAIDAIQAMKDLDLKYKMLGKQFLNDPQKALVDGTVAMDYWCEYQTSDLRKKLGDKLGIVPFPLGPDYKGTSKTADVNSPQAIAVAANSKNVEAAILWAECARLKETDQEAKDAAAKDKADAIANEFGTEEVYNLAKQMDDNSVIDSSAGYGDLSKVIDTIMNKSDGKSPTQAVEANKQAAQAQIDATMADAGK